MEGHADPHSRYTLSPGHPVGGGGGGGGGGGRGGSSIGGAISTGGGGGRTGRGAEKSVHKVSNCTTYCSQNYVHSVHTGYHEACTCIH